MAEARWEQLKEEGNKLFKDGKYKAAAAAYTAAIKLSPENPVLFSNRSAAYLKMEHHDKALADAEACIKLQADYDKGHFRAASALEAMGNLAAALPEYEAALRCNPNNSEIASRVKGLQTALRQQDKLERKKAQRAKAKPARAESAACSDATGQAGAANTGQLLPAAWARGLSEQRQYEWLTDCYRMRVDDDYAWGGCNLHGLYDPDHTKASVCEDFLIFCKLAVQKGVVPPGWKWDVFLQTAARLLPSAFEKSDAQEKWGGENVFSVACGGRSLRYTGEVVCGSSIMAQDDEPADVVPIREQIEGRWEELMAQAAAAAAGGGDGSNGGSAVAEVFGCVGGVDLWQKKLYNRLRLRQVDYY